MTAAGWIGYTAAGLVLMIGALVGLLVLRRMRRRRLLDIPRLVRGETDWFE